MPWSSVYTVRSSTPMARISSTVGTRYRLARRDDFPCKVLRIGNRYRVPTVELMRAIGVDERTVYTLDHGTPAWATHPPDY